MTKLELTVSIINSSGDGSSAATDASTTQSSLSLSLMDLQIVDYDGTTGKILGLPSLETTTETVAVNKPLPNMNIRDVLADEKECQALQHACQTLLRQSQSQQSSSSTQDHFQTLNLVFAAPQASQKALPQDRSSLQGVPLVIPPSAFATATELHLSCFCHVHYNAENQKFQITALEYAREHRSALLQQQFAAWLLQEKLEHSVIATNPQGQIVFWNRFASKLYQYSQEEAMGQEIRSLISSQKALPTGHKIMQQLNAEKQPFHNLFLVRNKRGQEFMAHATGTPIIANHDDDDDDDDDGNNVVKYIVGVSTDAAPLHAFLTQYQQLNASLEQEIVTRTTQLLARDKQLRLLGTAMNQADTGVMICDHQMKIVWCNPAVSTLLGLQPTLITGMFPWELPLQQKTRKHASLKQQQHHGNTSSIQSQKEPNHTDGEHAHNAELGYEPVGDAAVRKKLTCRVSSSGSGSEEEEENSSSLEFYFKREQQFYEQLASNITDSAQKNIENQEQGETHAEDDEGGSTSTDPTSTRQPVSAICYRVDRPSRPLHIMVHVDVLPPQTPPSLPTTLSLAARRVARKAANAILQNPDAHDLSQIQIDSYIPLQPTSERAFDTTITDTEKDDNAPPTNTIEEEDEEEEEEPLVTPPVNYMITLRDITAERLAEEAQATAEQESAANEAKTQMMQMLSHELRTPLQGIMGVASTSMMDIEEESDASALAAKSATNPAVDPKKNSKLGGSARSNSPKRCLSEIGTSSSSSTTGGIKGAMYDSLSTILASSRLLLTLINNTLDTRKINADMMQKIELSSVSMMACIRDSFQYCGPFATINEAVLELMDPATASTSNPPSTANPNNIKVNQILKASNSNSNLNAAGTPTILKKRFNVIGNRLRLEQVIVNLLSNGIKYTTPGTSVVASVRNSTLAQVLEEMKGAPSSSLKFLSEDDLNELEESCASRNTPVTIFSVRDHGKGIPTEEYGKVFGEFQQLDASAAKDNKYDGKGSGQSSGSGLGLNLSMKFVKLMHGHIWFQNCMDGGGGVTFSFYLNQSPSRRESMKGAVASDSEDAGAIHGESRPGQNLPDEAILQQEKISRVRVLVIDDSMINLKVLARMMTKLKVQHCQTALSGAEALKYLEPICNDPKLVPNLILCDLQMPGMDGYELMSHLREMNICSSPTVMACSADWSSETEGKCHDVGFDGLLRKPITVTNLKEFLTNTKFN